MDSAPLLTNLIVAGFSIALLVYVMQKKNTQPVAPADGRLIEMVDRLQIRIDTLERESDIHLQRTMALEMWAVRLSAQVVKLGGEPIPFAEIAQTQNETVNGMAKDRTTLLRILRQHYGVDEMDALALELGMSEGALGQGSIDARAARCVQFAQKQNRMLDLAFIIWRDRPDVVEGRK